MINTIVFKKNYFNQKRRIRDIQTNFEVWLLFFFFSEISGLKQKKKKKNKKKNEKKGMSDKLKKQKFQCTDFFSHSLKTEYLLSLTQV